MRRIAALIVAGVLLATLTVPADAGGRRTTYAMTDCRHLRTTPRTILFACGDGNYYVDHLRWFRWRPWKAAGFGLFHQNDCRPSCADGTFHAEWGWLWLRNRDRCTPPGKFVFQHVRVRYVGTLLGRHRTAFGHLGCPIR
ncbi:MAG TPA: hypothetical protein VIC52_01180 [Actinomycetota bacterium]